MTRDEIRVFQRSQAGVSRSLKSQAVRLLFVSSTARQPCLTNGLLKSCFGDFCSSRGPWCTSLRYTWNCRILQRVILATHTYNRQPLSLDSLIWESFSTNLKTRSSAIAEGPRDASCQLKSCQLPRNSTETTRQVLTKSMVWSWRFSRRQCAIENVHSTMTRSSRLSLSQVS